MSQLQNVEVIEGIELSLWPWESADLIAAELEAIFAEIESMPGLDWPPDDDPVSDPNWLRWLDEGGQVCGCAWSETYGDVVALADRADHVGA